MEFLVEFEIEVPAGAHHEEVERRQRAESTAAAKLADDGYLARLWTVSAGGNEEGGGGARGDRGAAATISQAAHLHAGEPNVLPASHRTGGTRRAGRACQAVPRGPSRRATRAIPSPVIKFSIPHECPSAARTG